MAVSVPGRRAARPGRPIVGAHGRAREKIGGPYSTYLRTYERGDRDTLTIREYQVLECFAQGAETHKEVAALLGITYQTVLSHTRMARLKLRRHTTRGCIIDGIKEGWLR